MKLIINKNQADKKGFFGGNKGVNFSLEYKVQLTSEEQELISKYKVQNETLMTNEKGDRSITIQDMINGRSLTTQNIEILQNNEDVAIGVCKTFKNYLNILRSFGGDYILEFKDDGVYNEKGEKLE